MCRVGWPWWTPSKTERKGNEMNNDENWENEIDWSKRTVIVGGPIFYEFLKTQAIPVLDEGLRQMAATRAESERKLHRWGAIAERAANLSDCFAALTGEADFMRMVHDFDEGTKAMFEGESIPSIGAWLIIGKRLTGTPRPITTPITTPRCCWRTGTGETGSTCGRPARGWRRSCPAIPKPPGSRARPRSSAA